MSTGMINTAIGGKQAGGTDARIEKERKLLRHLPKEYKFSLITGRPLGTLLSVSVILYLMHPPGRGLSVCITIRKEVSPMPMPRPMPRCIKVAPKEVSPMPMPNAYA